MGPGKVVFQDGKVIFVRHGSVLIRVSANRIVRKGEEFAKEITGEDNIEDNIEASYSGNQKVRTVSVDDSDEETEDEAPKEAGDTENGATLEVNAEPDDSRSCDDDVENVHERLLDHTLHSPPAGGGGVGGQEGEVASRKLLSGSYESLPQPLPMHPGEPQQIDTSKSDDGLDIEEEENSQEMEDERAGSLEETMVEDNGKRKRRREDFAPAHKIARLEDEITQMVPVKKTAFPPSTEPKSLLKRVDTIELEQKVRL